MKISNKMECYQEPRPPAGRTYNKVIGGGGVRVLDLTPNPKVSKNPIQFTTLEYNFCKPEAPEAKKLKDEIP